MMSECLALRASEADYDEHADEAAHEAKNDGTEFLTPWDRFHDKMYPLVKMILAQRPATIEGLAIQAKAISFSDYRLWDRVEGSWDVRQRDFIELVCVLTGVEPFRLMLARGVCSPPVVA